MVHASVQDPRQSPGEVRTPGGSPGAERDRGGRRSSDAGRGQGAGRGHVAGRRSRPLPDRRTATVATARPCRRVRSPHGAAGSSRAGARRDADQILGAIRKSDGLAGARSHSGGRPQTGERRPSPAARRGPGRRTAAVVVASRRRSTANHVSGCAGRLRPGWALHCRNLGGGPDGSHPDAVHRAAVRSLRDAGRGRNRDDRYRTGAHRGRIPPAVGPRIHPAAGRRRSWAGRRRGAGPRSRHRLVAHRGPCHSIVGRRIHPAGRRLGANPRSRHSACQMSAALRNVRPPADRRRDAGHRGPGSRLVRSRDRRRRDGSPRAAPCRRACARRSCRPQACFDGQASLIPFVWFGRRRRRQRYQPREIAARLTRRGASADRRACLLRGSPGPPGRS
jgi:hypothetical protein